MITYSMNITYLTCLIIYKAFPITATNLRKDISDMLADVPKNERHKYIEFFHMITGGEQKMQYYKIATKTIDGDLLIKCILEEPALLVTQKGTLLEIAEEHILLDIKKENQVVIPLPKNQKLLDNFFLNNGLEDYIKVYLTIHSQAK